MEFGIQIEPQFGFDYDAVLAISENAVRTGFSTMWFSDHFMLDENAVDRVLLDPWLLMASLVRVNKDVKVGSLVFCNSYRNPALTAKMAATLDTLSEGRFEFGYGAGWKEIEYGAYGYDFPSDHVRIDQLAEALKIIRGIWTHDKFSFSGSHYKVDDIVSFPKPYQKTPRIWIGTMKAKIRMLEITAKYGDGINIAWSFTPEQCRTIFKTLDDLGQKYGKERGSIQKSVGLWARCFENEEDMISALIENAAKRGMDIDEYKRRVDSSLWGTPEAIVEKLTAYQELGVNQIILMFPHQNEIEQAKLIGTKVIPKL